MKQQSSRFTTLLRLYRHIHAILSIAVIVGTVIADSPPPLVILVTVYCVGMQLSLGNLQHIYARDPLQEVTVTIHVPPPPPSIFDRVLGDLHAIGECADCDPANDVICWQHQQLLRWHFEAAAARMRKEQFDDPTLL